MLLPPELEWLIYDFVRHEETQRCALKFLRDYMIIISEVWWGLSTILKIRMSEIEHQNIYFDEELLHKWISAYMHRYRQFKAIDCPATRKLLLQAQLIRKSKPQTLLEYWVYKLDFISECLQLKPKIDAFLIEHREWFEQRAPIEPDLFSYEPEPYETETKNWLLRKMWFKSVAQTIDIERCIAHLRYDVDETNFTRLKKLREGEFQLTDDRCWKRRNNNIVEVVFYLQRHISRFKN